MAANSTIEVSSLYCRRGERLVLRDLSFSARAGDFIVVTGPNGAGKSTLLRALAGLIPIEKGTIAIDPFCHFVSHSDALKPALTARENLSYTAGLLGGARRDPMAALSALGLGGLADMPARHLSAGQKRRLALARLLAVQRSVWLLDEPLTGLDRENAGRLSELIADHRGAGGCVVAATHQPFELGNIVSLELGRR